MPAADIAENSHGMYRYRGTPIHKYFPSRTLVRSYIPVLYESTGVPYKIIIGAVPLCHVHSVHKVLLLHVLQLASDEMNKEQEEVLFF